MEVREEESGNRFLKKGVSQESAFRTYSVLLFTYGFSCSLHLRVFRERYHILFFTLEAFSPSFLYGLFQFVRSLSDLSSQCLYKVSFPLETPLENTYPF